MWDFFRHLFLSIIVSLFYFGLYASECPSLLRAIEKTTEKQWTFEHGSTAAVLTGNLALLTVAESMRAFSGVPAFNSGFLVNAVTDSVTTMVGHQIALAKIPSKFQKGLTKTKEFFFRIGANIAANTATIYGFWSASALAMGTHIDAGEFGGIIGFCAGAYTSLQLLRNGLFVSLPKKLDQRFASKIKAEMPDAFDQLSLEAEKRATELGIDSEESQKLFLTMLDGLVGELPFEMRLSDPKIRFHLSEEAQKKWKAVEEAPLEKKSKLRMKAIRFNLDELNAEFITGERRVAMMNLLYLGEPFTYGQSIEILQSLRERHWRKVWLIRGGAVVDRLVGGVIAGGLIFRQMTEAALRD